MGWQEAGDGIGIVWVSFGLTCIDVEHFGFTWDVQFVLEFNRGAPL